MNLIEISQRMTRNGRVYDTPDGSFPSVTTVLSKMKDKSGLDDWVNKIGKEEADRIKNEAAARGTEMHRMIEARFFGENVETKNDVARRLYQSLELHLRTLKPEAIEIPLYSKTLRVAGRTDCIGIYDGELSVVDFKTSRKEKKKEWVHDYFIQATLYALMAYELYELECKQIVILIAVEEGFPQVFKERVRSYAKEAIDITRRYHAMFGS